jgi:acyl-coenzyme A thioesterase 13
MTIPAGFTAMDRSEGFIGVNGPLFFRLENHSLVVGMLVEPRHCNSHGRLHGGMMAALVDIALGENIGYASLSEEALASLRQDRRADTGPRKNLVTVSLSMDYLGSTKAGDWIEVSVEIDKIGKTLAFASAYVTRDGERVARCSAVYRDLGGA